MVNKHRCITIGCIPISTFMFWVVANIDVHPKIVELKNQVTSFFYEFN